MIDLTITIFNVKLLDIEKLSLSKSQHLQFELFVHSIALITRFN